jgi:[ribosomal protein S5]-alanine N-acetyltransferase
MEGMAIAPVLAGPWVRLRMPRVEDAEAMFTGLASDPDVTRYLSWTPHPDVAETRRVITDVFNVGAGPAWLIERRDTGEFVGTCGRLRPRPNTVELGCCGLALEGRLARHAVFPNPGPEPQDGLMYGKAVR